MFRPFSPPLPFLNFVERFWVSKSRFNKGFAISEYYPNANADLVFELSPTHCKVLFFGAVTQKSYLQTNHQYEYLSVQFRPGGCNHLNGIHPKELVDQFAVLDQINGWPVDQIGILLNRAVTPNMKINILCRVLQGLTQNCLDNGSIERSAIKQIFESYGLARIKNVARSHAVSVRHLETIFKNKLGVSPKFFARTMRLQRVLQTFYNGIADTLADLACYAGYADQAHFIHDFKKLTGRQPSFFLKPNREDPKITYIPDLEGEPDEGAVFHHF